MSKLELTDIDYWDKKRKFFKPYHPKNNEFYEFLNAYLPKRPEWSCAEIGGYPGSHLVFCAKNFGYKPVAIEFSNYTEHIQDMFEFNEIENFEIINKNFFEIENRAFDIVLSFGFIEHFTKLEEVFSKHIEMLKPGGYLALSVPNFKGFQGWLRRHTMQKEFFDELWATHNPEAMSENFFLNMADQHNLDVIFCGARLKGDLWIDSHSSEIRSNRKWVISLYHFLQKLVRPFLPSNMWISPIIVMVARKRLESV
jgi:SAM-dependent methyltransferase